MTEYIKMSDIEQNEENQNNPQSQYKEMVKSWLETDEKISKLMTTLKELKDEKKQYENYIIDYMDENHNIEVSIPEGKIKKAMIKSKGGFNEKVIITGLAEITKDETKAKDITKVISQKRENKEKIYLKKCKRAI
jgi:septal ring factor EnvC (AmiA/AmiB activator)